MPVQHTEEIETIGRDGFCHSEHRLDLLQDIKSLLILLLRRIKLYKIEVHVALLREILEKLLIHADGKLRPRCHGIKTGKTVSVPEVGRVKLRRHPVALLGSLGIILRNRTLGHIIPCRIILGIIRNDLLEYGHGTFYVSFVVSCHSRKHQILILRIRS